MLPGCSYPLVLAPHRFSRRPENPDYCRKGSLGPTPVHLYRGVKSVRGHQVGSTGALPGNACHIDPVDPYLMAFLPIHTVEGVDLLSDGQTVTAFRKGRDAPIRDGEDQNPMRISTGQEHGSIQEVGKLGPVLLHWPAAILVVDADGERNQGVRPRGIRSVDPIGQLVGGPPGSGNDLRVRKGNPPVTSEASELHRPTSRGIDALTYRVGIAQRQESKAVHGGFL